MLWSRQQSEKLKAENYQADNFLSFGRKAAALLNDANLTQERVPTFFETRIEPSPVGKSNAPDPRRIAGADRFKEMISSPATAWKIKRPRADKLMGPISFPKHLAEKQTPPTPGASLGQLGSRRPFPPTISHKMKRPRPQVHRWGRRAQGCQFHPRFFYRKGKASNKKKKRTRRDSRFCSRETCGTTGLRLTGRCWQQWSVFQSAPLERFAPCVKSREILARRS